MITELNLTPRQQKWFASVREGLERDTGKSLAEWVAIARNCPEVAQRARLKWLKDQYGLLQNRAMWVLDEAFGGESGWSNPNALTDALWSEPGSRTILAAIDKAATLNPETIRTGRKGFTAWSRKVQFSAARPLRGGGAILGLALPPSYSGLLSAAKNEPWSERLKSRMALDSISAVDFEVEALLTAAWSAS